MATKKIVKTAAQSAPPAIAKTITPVAKKAVKKVAAPKPVIQAGAKAVAMAAPPDIAGAAYLNYCRRVEEGLPGDSHGDWLAAERQCNCANGTA